jgi:uncharacterized protein YjiS (DUF1127 family)
MESGLAHARPRGDHMFKMLSFRSDEAFWPLAERPDFNGGQASGGMLGKLAAAARRFRSERAVRLAMAELESLDDRTLKDIGISRDEIWHAVRYGRGAAFDATRWS